MPFNKKGILAACGAGALLFSMSALANNPPPTDPDPGDGGSSPYQRGPDPSVSFLEADRGNYSVSTSRVSGLVSGFGGGNGPSYLPVSIICGHPLCAHPGAAARRLPAAGPTTPPHLRHTCVWLGVLPAHVDPARNPSGTRGSG